MARGYNALADVIKMTVDGEDLRRIWSELQQTVSIRNERRLALASLFTFDTTVSHELVAQGFGGDDFEQASEYGVPQGLRNELETTKIGYDFAWYDKASRYTWQFLTNASSEQIASIHAAALEADNRLVFNKIMRRIFNPSKWQNEDGTDVFGFWNGVDGQPPANQWGEEFAPTYSHYRTTGGATIVSADVDEAVEAVESQGFGLRENGDRIIVLANPEQADIISGFRVANGDKHDAVPTKDAPAFITNDTFQGVDGERPPGEFNGLSVACGYGDAWVVSDRQIPAGYFVALATGGPNSERNPLGFREAVQPSLQGLIQVGGGSAEYPLQDSYYLRGFGVGVRQRGAGCVMQVTANADYAAPAQYA